MSEIIRVPYEPVHFDFIEADPMFAGLKANMNAATLLTGGKAVTWIDRTQGEVLAIAGYVVRCPGVAWIWFLPSPRGARMLLRVTRYFKRWVATLEDGVRIEAHVVAGFREGHRWTQMLGLERETGEPMRLWDGCDDYHLYARVTGDQSNSV